jgi:hypothetical protein
MMAVGTPTGLPVDFIAAIICRAVSVVKSGTLGELGKRPWGLSLSLNHHAETPEITINIGIIAKMGNKYFKIKTG